MDSRAERYAMDVAAVLAGVLGPDLTGVYLHGSAVLGGFDARRSDVDILAVSRGAMTAAQQQAAAAALSEEQLPSPAHGLELSVVTLAAARHPVARPAFELHLTTEPGDHKVVDGHARGGDPDLVLHFAVCRAAGRRLGPGLPAAEAFAPVAGELVRAQLAAELRWGAELYPGEYAVLNACRAWRFAADGTLVSKIDGGEWALSRVPGPSRGLIVAALARQRCEPAAELDARAVRRFVRDVLRDLPRPPVLRDLPRPPGTPSAPPETGPCGYDAELRRHNEILSRACGIQVRDQVLDIGCGTGQTTRQAARTARAGSALGVDVSALAIDRARELARAEGLANVTFEHASAQVHRFPQEGFDLAISRFGTMFFDDPVAAFANIRRGLRPAGRLVMMVWQAHERNEWDVAIRQSLAGPEGAVAVPAGGPDAFSLADPPTVRKILAMAGFADVTFTDVREPVYYGPDVAAALDWVRGFASTSEVLKRLDPAAAARAVRRLREALAAHLSDDGVWFDSRAWIVTARRSRSR